jgi:hypothetical protein
VVPVAHVTALHTLRPGLRSEVFEVVVQVTEALGGPVPIPPRTGQPSRQSETPEP